MKKIPMRTCVITREKLEKKDLIRVVRTPEGSVVIDETGKMNGRGAYLKKDIEVINKAQKSKVLDKVLETSISEELYDNLRNNVTINSIDLIGQDASGYQTLSGSAIFDLRVGDIIQVSNNQPDAVYLNRRFWKKSGNSIKCCRNIERR